ncbi:regulatory protein GntR HTH [Desulfarculus baarsii DSM 2075]|uniref:Regulatory protein GntR HTH n=1 Tax=Desulfarculus baarsii (strain ATCC 33931 / DSM 2075 / LMG 7858 / VKM B-1802 / 2st14) TaxID=644282 RepID=E1QD93_DESB2|nr:FadR/GntR family transcriptional regulator [Desulfarculus baarsii]ADK83412.1 regulatory protein GntR HTH [Desulfarculus baarsii DSM 2075]
MAMKSDQIDSIGPLEKTPTMSRRVAEYLARLIAGGSLRPGEKLPGETALAQRLGVSRPTLREALGVLRAKGLVEVRPRSGTYVTSALAGGGPSAVGELVAVDPTKIWELLEIRKVVDTAAAALAASRRTPADLIRLAELRQSVRNLGGHSLIRRGEGGKAYARFFAFIAQASHNTLFSHLLSWVSTTLRHLLPYSRDRLAGRPESGPVIMDQIQAIAQAIEDGDPDRARRLTMEHLEYLEKALREVHALQPPVVIGG